MMPEERKVGGRRKCAAGFYWPIHPQKTSSETMNAILGWFAKFWRVNDDGGLLELEMFSSLFKNVIAQFWN
jgi:hypothetical protein